MKRQLSLGSHLLSRVGATDDEIATRLGCNRVQVTQWRGGARRPGAANRAQLLKVYKIPRESWDEPPPASASSSKSDPPAIPDDGSVRAKAERLNRMANALLDELEGAKDSTMYERAKVMAKAMAVITGLGRLTGEAQEIGEGRILRLPAWRRIEDVVARALDPWPEAMVAVGEALQREFGA